MKHLLPAVLLFSLLAPSAARAQQPHAEHAPAAATADAALLQRADASRIKGAEDAPVTIVEVSDFQCPFCRQFSEQTLAQLDSAYLQTGKARLIYFNYPVPGHERAWHASEAALCAGAQDRFWPMHDRLFAEQRAWSTAPDPGALFRGYAADLGLDLDAFRRCTEEDLVAPLLVNDLLTAARAGVGGTPTFVFNGETARAGALSFQEMAEQIEELLK